MFSRCCCYNTSIFCEGLPYIYIWSKIWRSNQVVPHPEAKIIRKHYILFMFSFFPLKYYAYSIVSMPWDNGIVVIFDSCKSAIYFNLKNIHIWEAQGLKIWCLIHMELTFLHIMSVCVSHVRCWETIAQIINEEMDYFLFKHDSCRGLHSLILYIIILIILIIYMHVISFNPLRPSKCMVAIN